MKQSNSPPEQDYLRPGQCPVDAPGRAREVGRLVGDSSLPAESHESVARVYATSPKWMANRVALLVFSGAAPHTKARESENRLDPPTASPPTVALWLTTVGGLAVGGSSRSRSRVL